jgi:RNA polymerase sigma factor (sigma-70 family)
VIRDLIESVTDPTAREAIEAVWRLESTRLIAGLVRIVRDVGLAEDLAQDALVAALAQWPEAGVPDNPGAWLMTIAKRRGVDQFRRRDRQDQIYAALAHAYGNVSEEDFLAAVDHVDDDVLRLIFLCCHPLLTPEAQCTLTLKLVGGLSTREIARAYLTTEATVAQRIVRAKRTLTEAGAALEEPSESERGQRLTTVLSVIYLLYNEGYSATAGSEWMRPTLCDEALRLGRILAALAPRDSEVHGLTALMELQSSRLAARIAEDGSPILLLDQDRSQWDPVHIMRGLSALDRAEELARELGPYALQAAIAACHARAETAEATDWVRIVELYQRLAQVTGSPVVEVNRAVALGMAYGPEAGLALLDQLEGLPALSGYHLLPSVRGDLLDKLGRHEEATAEFARAATLTQNERERALLLDRASGRSGRQAAL